MSGNQISIEEYRKGSLILIRLIQIALSLEQKQFVIDEIKQYSFLSSKQRFALSQGSL